MWNLAFFLICLSHSDDAEGMNINKPIQASDNADCLTSLSRPSDHIEQERLAETGRAVADLAHLVKNILQVMSGCGEIIDLALSTDQMDRVRQAWQLYLPSFWRLKKFQLDLIKFTKNYPLNPDLCNVNSVIAAAARQMEPFFVQRHITFENRAQIDDCSIVADGEKLRDTVVNLLVNAVDNLDDKPGQVAITAELINSGQAVRITVSDSGPRLETAMCRTLLRPYERCRNMLGSGLEIPLVLQVVQAHGGSLALNADLSNTGNLVEITLPVKT